MLNSLHLRLVAWMSRMIYPHTQCSSVVDVGTMSWKFALRWRYNGRDGASNHRPRDCLLNFYSGTYQSKHQNSASLVFVRGIHQSPVWIPRTNDQWRGKYFHLTTSSRIYELQFKERISYIVLLTIYPGISAPLSPSFCWKQKANIVMLTGGKLPSNLLLSYKGELSIYDYRTTTVLWSVTFGIELAKCLDCCYIILNPWWRHQKETFSALLALCAGNSPVTGEFPAQRPMTRSFDVFFDMRLNKRLSKQSWGRWFETQSRPLWHHSNVILNLRVRYDPTLNCL